MSCEKKALNNDATIQAIGLIASRAALPSPLSSPLLLCTHFLARTKRRLVSVVKLFVVLIMRMAVEKLDRLGEWEASGIACKVERERLDCDKERLGRVCGTGVRDIIKR
jgi:hypothetical protein